MAKGINQKLKLLYIVQILEKMSDENHPVSTRMLIDELAKHDICAERKSIYDDINQLIDFGYDIVTVILAVFVAPVLLSVTFIVNA